ncbi:MAG: DUF4358 domain-containing protein [Bacilli bacterium]
MKKMMSIMATFALSVGLLAGCGNDEPKQKDIDVAALVNQMVENGYVRMPKELNDADVKDIYKLNSDDVEEYGIAETGIMPGNNTILVVQAKEGKVENVKASLESYLKDKVGAAFYPDEKEVAEKAKVEVNGNYVTLFILDDENLPKAQKDFADALK